MPRYQGTFKTSFKSSLNCGRQIPACGHAGARVRTCLLDMWFSVVGNRTSDSPGRANPVCWASGRGV
jgi:hypothetical protein